MASRAKNLATTLGAATKANSAMSETGPHRSCQRSFAIVSTSPDSTPDSPLPSNCLGHLSIKRLRSITFAEHHLRKDRLLAPIAVTFSRPRPPTLPPPSTLIQIATQTEKKRTRISANVIAASMSSLTWMAFEENC